MKTAGNIASIEKNGSISKIKTKTGINFLVSNCDLDLFEKWSYLRSRSGYIICTQYRKIDGFHWRTDKYLHHLILNKQGLSSSGEWFVDHANRDPLDNTRENLRPCSRSENMRNRTKNKGVNHSKYIGVSRSGNKWRANFAIKNKQYYLGLFHDEISAAKARDKAVKEKFGSFAVLNFPNHGTSMSSES